jgi:HAD superfamily hydrolase (TIGR01509 family)
MMKTSGGSLVIFDHDGLMVNTEDVVFAALQEIFRRYGHDFTWDYYCTSIGLPISDSVRMYLRDIPLSVSYDDFLAERNALVGAYLNERLAPMPGLVELLDELERRGAPMAVATSGMRATITRALERFGLARYFAAVVCIEDVARGKPHPDLILRALGVTGTRPDCAIMLEDSPHGVEAAHRAGVYTIAVPTRGIDPQLFAKADVVVKDLVEARDVVLRRLARSHR